jgi:hypothetical protein
VREHLSSQRISSDKLTAKVCWTSTSTHTGSPLIASSKESRGSCIGSWRTRTDTGASRPTSTTSSRSGSTSGLRYMPPRATAPRAGAPLRLECPSATALRMTAPTTRLAFSITNSPGRFPDTRAPANAGLLRRGGGTGNTDRRLLRRARSSRRAVRCLSSALRLPRHLHLRLRPLAPNRYG